MENKEYMIPFISVVLGWVLSQLSGVFSLSRDDRRLRSMAIPPMMDLYFQQYRINKIVEYFNLKLGDSLEQLHHLYDSGKISEEDRVKTFNKLFSLFEKTRQENIDLPKHNKETLFSSIEKAVDSLSKVDATSAYKLARLSNEFSLMLEIKFPDEKIDAKHYIEVHGSLIQIFRTDIKNLKKLILKVALNIGTIDFIKIYLLLRSEEKVLNETPKEVLDDVLKLSKT